MFPGPFVFGAGATGDTGAVGGAIPSKSSCALRVTAGEMTTRTIKQNQGLFRLKSIDGDNLTNHGKMDREIDKGHDPCSLEKQA